MGDDHREKRGYSIAAENRRRHDDDWRRGDEDESDRRSYNRDYCDEGDTGPRDWKCVECATWNYPDDTHCYRCGLPAECRGDFVPEEKLDEFGRVLKKVPKLPRWPPSFETNGSAYVFDGRSSMFYEANSDFFYDPNSKLYYGNKQQTYYQFNETTKKFEEVEKTGSQEAGSDQGNSQPTTESKAAGTKISIKLKTKTLGKAKKVGSKDAKKPVPEPKVSKKYESDLSKWSERQSEKQQELLTVQKAKVPTTVKGEPICQLCRRKFPSVAKLQYHEKASKLHQENLAKRKKVEQQQKDYKDRAQLRRDMHGPESVVGVPGAPLSESSLTASVPAVALANHAHEIPNQDTLGDHNIGNQMLRKLGWKPDQGKNVMDQDWKRIETMATEGRNTTGQSGIGG